MNVYISKTANTLNGKPYTPEDITPRICLNPLYPAVKLDFPCEILLDSSAYQNEGNRVTFQQAYDRQVAFQIRIGQSARYIVAYDKIGERETTMLANEFLVKLELPTSQEKILVVQGETPEEYSRCLHDLLSLQLDYDFVIGFGGVAKAGVRKNIESKLYAAIEENVNRIGLLKRVHIFGCFTTRILKRVESLLPGVIVSVDTASCEIRSVMGNVFTGGKWVKTYMKSQKRVDYQPCDLAHDNVRRAVSFFEGETPYRYQNLIGGICS